MSSLEAHISKRVGAKLTRLVRCSSPLELPLDRGAYELVETLGGIPVICPDIRSLAKDAHEKGLLLLVDNSVPTSWGSAPCRRGADVAFESLDSVLGVEGSGLAAVSVTADVPRIDGLESARDDELVRVEAALAAWDTRRRKANDEAQVIAHYLRCHPAVGEVRYPGLPGDPSHEVASALLLDGFGPIVDYRLVGLEGWVRFMASGTDPRASVMELEKALSQNHHNAES